MLDENLNEEYINKLDGIIEFFKAEKEFDLHYIIIGEEDSKFRMTFNISIIVVLIATTNLISLVETFPEIFIQIMILFTLFLLLIIFTGDFLNSKRRTKYIKESVKFNLIANFFYSLKILPYEVNLFPVINTIKKRYHVKTGFIESNQEKYFYDIWYKEIIDCLDNINKEIIKK